MTEERKQELRQLLGEAVATENLKILYKHGRGKIYEYWLPIPASEYQRYLQQRWAAYSAEPSWFFFSVKPHIVNEVTESRLLGFIREELAPFIEKDSVYFDSHAIEGNTASGLRLQPIRGGVLMLDVCLDHLLKIAIVSGIENAVSIFARFSCTEGAHGYFQSIALLEGISLEAEIQVFKGVRLFTLPDADSERPPSQLATLFFDMREGRSLRGKTVLAIDRPVYSIFSKRSQEAFLDGVPIDNLPFQFKLDGEKFTDSKAVNSFGNLFCQALSIACDSAVQISGTGWLLEEGKFFHPGNGGVRPSRYRGLFGKTKKVGPDEIDEAKRLYHILDKNPVIRKDLRIPIDRWIKSKASGSGVDKIIDLGIALEALYLYDTGDNRELSFRLRLRAAWHLGKNEEDRKNLIKRFGEIYNCRSNAVHNGELGETVKSGGNQIPTREFIERSQDLCLESILKILDDGGFPAWDRLILGANLDA